jgi:hypothetical protein
MTNAKQNRLIGTWKLVSIVAEDLTTGHKTDLWGADPLGYITYGADGRMMVINVRNDRTPPAGEPPTHAEAAELYRGMLAYGGRYTVEEDAVIHHIDISWNEAWTGTAQRRLFRFESDERVHLSTRPSPDPVHGHMSTRTMTWEKMK